MGGTASKEAMQASQNAVRKLTLELGQLQQQKTALVASSSRALALETEINSLSGELRAAKDELEEKTVALKLEAQNEKAAARQLRVKLDAVQRELEAQKRVDAERANTELLKAASQQLLDAQRASQANESKAEPEHPTFGRLLVDCGYKRIYASNPVSVLAHTTVWNKQRAFRQARAEKIADSKLKSSIKGLPGTISIVEIGPSSEGQPSSSSSSEEPGQSELVIIDGQHRLGACSLLSARGQLPEEMKRILVEVYQRRMTQGEVSELFIEINRAEPVLPVDLPSIQNVTPAAGGGKEADTSPAESSAEMRRESITDAVLALKSKFPAMFSDSQNPRIPHCNVDRYEYYLPGLP